MNVCVCVYFTGLTFMKYIYDGNDRTSGVTAFARQRRWFRIRFYCIANSSRPFYLVSYNYREQDFFYSFFNAHGDVYSVGSRVGTQRTRTAVV